FRLLGRIPLALYNRLVERYFFRPGVAARDYQWRQARSLALPRGEGRLLRMFKPTFMMFELRLRKRKSGVFDRLHTAPGRFVVKARLGLKVVLSSPFGRKMLLYFLRDRVGLGKLELYPLIHDLLRFEILCGNSAALRDAQRSFRVSA